MNTNLLCTFTKRNKLENTLISIVEKYTVVFGKIFVLQDTNNYTDLMCTYNIDTGNIGIDLMENTISLHRKKHTNTLYTINALNSIVAALNGGELDSSYELPWEDFRNCILVTSSDGGFRKIDTKIFDIILIED